MVRVLQGCLGGEDIFIACCSMPLLSKTLMSPAALSYQWGYLRDAEAAGSGIPTASLAVLLDPLTACGYPQLFAIAKAGNIVEGAYKVGVAAGEHL